MTHTIGQRLKAEREEQRLTIEKVFEATRIRIPYLQALEADDLSKMPSPVQARGYLRNYVEFLGLNYEKLLNEMRSEQKPSNGIDVIIGPADDTATLRHSSPPQDDSALAFQPAPQTPEPILIEEVETPVEDAAPPLVGKPVSARRKKTDSQPEPDSAQPPRRRGRKKVEPEPELVPVIEPEAEIIVEPLASSESVRQQSELVIEEAIETRSEEEPQPDVSDNLWQTWLNRLNSVLAARAKRPTLVVKESVSFETQPDSDVMESEIGSQTDDTQEHSEFQ